MAEETAVWVETQDGESLAADVVLPPGARAGVVVCHPHPLFGGDRHNPVVEIIFQAAAAAGMAALRFDFRGVGHSSGEHGEGEAERLDAAAGLDTLAALLPDASLLLAGYSFGADVALTVAHPRLYGWLAVAPPLRLFAPSAYLAGTDHRPKRLLVPEHDQYDPPDQAQARTAGWTATEIDVIALGDHFLNGRLAVVAERATARLSELAGLSS